LPLIADAGRARHNNDTVTSDGMQSTFEIILSIGAFGLIAIGLLGMVISSNLFRMVLALVIAEAGANLLLVLVGYRGDAVAPILGPYAADMPMVDPVPQVLVLTAIVIGVGVQALAVAALVRIYQLYGTLDVRKLRERFGLDVTRAAGLPPTRSLEAPVGGRPLPPPISGVEGRADSAGKRRG
jgi:multicomponent Na+:H+ antiporter subunit C